MGYRDVIYSRCQAQNVFNIIYCNVRNRFAFAVLLSKLSLDLAVNPLSESLLDERHVGSFQISQPFIL